MQNFEVRIPTLVLLQVFHYPTDRRETPWEPRAVPKLCSHQNSRKTNVWSRRNPQIREKISQIVWAHGHGKLPHGGRTVLLYEKQSCSTSHLRSVGPASGEHLGFRNCLQRLRNRVSGSETASKGSEIDFPVHIPEALVSSQIRSWGGTDPDLGPAPEF